MLSFRCEDFVAEGCREVIVFCYVRRDQPKRKRTPLEFTAWARHRARSVWAGQVHKGLRRRRRQHLHYLRGVSVMFSEVIT